MKAVQNLPEHYKEIISVDLQKDKKLAVLVNMLSLAIMVILAIPALFVVPFKASFDVQNDSVGVIYRLAALIVLLVVYTVLHELTHGVAMKLCGTKKVRYGFTGMYGYAACDEYYDKKGYIFVALAPVVLWGVVIGVANALVSVEWFWIMYLLQLCNLSGAAGDLYVTVKFSRMPKDILVRDYGVRMTVYSGGTDENNG